MSVEYGVVLAHGVLLPSETLMRLDDDGALRGTQLDVCPSGNDDDDDGWLLCYRPTAIVVHGIDHLAPRLLESRELRALLDEGALVARAALVPWLQAHGLGEAASKVGLILYRSVL